MLFISHRFPPQFLGGSDRYAYELACEMRSAGHSIWVLSNASLHDDTAGKGQLRVVNDTYDGFPVRRLSLRWDSMPDPYRWLYNHSPLIEDEILRYIETVQPDIVHVTACDYVSNAALTAPQKAGIPVVMNLTGKWHICPTATLLRSDGRICEGRQPGMVCLECMFGQTRTFQMLQRLPTALSRGLINLTRPYPALHRHVGSLNFIHAVDGRNQEFKAVLDRVDAVVSPSECHRQVFSRCGLIPAERIRLVKAGQRPLSGPVPAKVASDNIRFAYTGILAPHKGVHTLIEAFTRLPENAPVELSIYGDVDGNPEYTSRLRELAGSRPNIHFRGAYAITDLERIFTRTDVVVVPSVCVENAPRTIIEAFQYHTPIIGSDTLGVIEHIEHGGSGLIFKRGDPANLAALMQRILSEPDLLPTLVKGIPRLRTTAEETDELVSIFNELVAKAHAY